MSEPSNGRLRIAAVIGFFGVALGAFGAHGLRETLEANGRVDVWHTAVFYHLVHAVVLVVLAIAPGEIRSKAWVCFAAGIAVFSGSLYTLALTNISVLGAITPIGGALFLVGWGILAVKG